MAQRAEIGSQEEIQLEEAQAAMLEKVTADLSGPRFLKEPGTPDWCWQTIGHLQLMWQFFEGSSERYLSTLAEAEAYKVWEVVPESNPFGTKEKMIATLELGDEKEAYTRLQQKALKAVALRQQGRPSKGEEKHYQGNVSQGNSSDYLLARIKRDRPDVFDRALKGEFKTTAEAARAAGIVKKRSKTVSLGNNFGRLAETLHKYYGLEAFTELSKEMLRLQRQMRG